MGRHIYIHVVMYMLMIGRCREDTLTHSYTTQYILLLIHFHYSGDWHYTGVLADCPNLV